MILIEKLKNKKKMKITLKKFKILTLKILLIVIIKKKLNIKKKEILIDVPVQGLYSHSK